MGAVEDYGDHDAGVRISLRRVAEEAGGSSPAPTRSLLCSCPVNTLLCLLFDLPPLDLLK